MKFSRSFVSLLAILALAALFLKLPEIPGIKCRSCFSLDPYLALIGSCYFGLLLAVSLLFPTLPGKRVSRSGLTWAVSLAACLTYIALPNWCPACLIAHACNIAIWMLWTACPSNTKDRSRLNMRERLYLAALAPISVIALFSSLNLTFMAYGFRINNNLSSGLKEGDVAPKEFIADSFDGKGVILNFISKDCPYCKEQLPILSSVASEFSGGSYRFINICPSLTPELLQSSSAFEWLEDGEGRIRKLFKVSGYPTMFVIDKSGKIELIVRGVSDELKSELFARLQE